MLSKEILNDITLDELKDIAKEWHRIDDICKATPDGYNQFEITYEDDWYIDRDVDTKHCSLLITTDKDAGETCFSDVIVLYDEDRYIGDTDIEELESFIKELEGA